jgi:hypothetical protein
MRQPIGETPGWQDAEPWHEPTGRQEKLPKSLTSRHDCRYHCRWFDDELKVVVTEDAGGEKDQTVHLSVNFLNSREQTKPTGFPTLKKKGPAKAFLSWPFKVLVQLFTAFRGSVENSIVVEIENDVLAVVIEAVRVGVVPLEQWIWTQTAGERRPGFQIDIDSLAIGKAAVKVENIAI